MFQKKWHQRFFTLQERSIEYRYSADDIDPIGSIELDLAVSVGDTRKGKKRNAFDIVTIGGTWYLAARDDDEYQMWMAELRKRIVDRSQASVVKEGWLLKKGSSGWKKRYFVLFSSGFLAYFRSPGDGAKFLQVLHRRRDMVDFSATDFTGAMPLRDSTVLRMGDFSGGTNVFALEIARDGRVFYASATSPEEMREWIRALRKAIRRENDGTDDKNADNAFDDEEPAEWETFAETQKKKEDALDPFRD
ncbi:MAG: hypothetical protein MHM6MM_008189 [Cercozoa sp. M6MM]